MTTSLFWQRALREMRMQLIVFDRFGFFIQI